MWTSAILCEIRKFTAYLLIKGFVVITYGVILALALKMLLI